TGTLGTVINNADGTFTYNANGAFESLAAGETATDKIGKTSSRDSGQSSTKTATVTITGQNDAPVALAISHGANEDGPSVALTANYSDVETHDTHTFSVDTTGTLGTVINNADGTFTYNANGAFESLAAGETATD